MSKLCNKDPYWPHMDHHRAQLHAGSLFGVFSLLTLVAVFDELVVQNSVAECHDWSQDIAKARSYAPPDNPDLVVSCTGEQLTKLSQ